MPPQDALLRSCSNSFALDSSTAARPSPVRLAIISEGVSTTWPLYVAQAKRLFEQEGVPIEVTLTGSSARQLQALKSGAFDIGFQQADHVVRAVEQGSDLFVFMPLTHAPDLSLVVSPAIHSFTDLRQRDIAVDGARSGYALLLRQLLAAKGLREGDYRFVEIGGSQERYDALKAGKAVASFLNPPFDRNLFARGFSSLGTAAEYFPGYVGSVAAARRFWAREHRETLVAFIRAMRAAYEFLLDRSHRDEAIAILLARLKVGPESARDAFEQYGNRGLPEMTDEGLQQVIDIVWAAEALTFPPASPGKYLDWTFLNAAKS